MRLSVDCKDPGYSPWAFRARVFVNGIERNNVVTADEEQRMALCRVIDENGNTVRDAFTFEVRTEIISGDVAIVLPEGWGT